MAASKKKANGQEQTRSLGTVISADLDEALEACAAEEQRLKRVVIERALIRYLTEGGFWPRGNNDKDKSKEIVNKSKGK